MAGRGPAGGGEHNRLGPGEHVTGWRGSAVWRGNAELDHARHTVSGHDHVLRAEVTVHETDLVDGRQAGGHADGDCLKIRPGQDTVSNDHLKQRRAGNVLTDQIGLVSLQAGVKNAGGAKWRYPLGHCGFGGEPVSSSCVLSPVGPEHADSHLGAIRTDSDEDRVVGRNARDSPNQAVPSNPLGIAGAQRRLLGHNRFRLGKQVDPSRRFVPYALCAVQCGESAKLLRSKWRRKCRQPVGCRGRMPARRLISDARYHDTHDTGGPGRCSPGPDVAEFPAGFGHNRAVLSVTTARTS